MFYHTTILEDFVESLYIELEIKEPEQIHIYDIANKLGIRVIFSHFGSRAFTKPFVGINIEQNLNEQEIWQDFGHELHHILMDVGVQFLMPKPWIDMREFKANSFMYHFCIPTFMLQKLEFPKYNSALFIANTFNVNLKFAEKRLNQYSNHLKQSRFDQMVKELYL